MTETELKKQIKALLCLIGAFPVPIRQGLGNMKGISDFLVCYKGRFVAIEAKSSKGKLSYDQKDFIDRVRKAGGIGFGAWSLEDVIRNLGIEGVHV